MTLEKERFWQMHLDNAGGPLLHFVPASLLDLESIEKAAREIGFAYFVVEARNVDSESALMDAFATSMNFPTYFGGDWNALLDFTRDLSWVKAEGYVLIISCGDGLTSMPYGGFPSLLGVMEATVRDWRDERGEFGERSGPVPFHVILSGNEVLREALHGGLKESLCEHLGEFAVNIIQAPVQLRRTMSYRDAEKLAATGADPELILSFLREHGMDERDSMYSIAGLLGKTVNEAKSLIYNSQTWSEVRKRDEQARKVARDARKDLGWNN